MSKASIPDPLKRRHLIEQDLSETQNLALADAYGAEGRVIESIQFLAKAGATERLMSVADEAVAAGDAFLLKQVGDALGRDFSVERWRELAECAEAQGRILYSEMARRQMLTGDS